MSKNSNKISYQGVFPIAPTPFQEDGSLDLESQKRVLDCMIDQGVDGICILANYSEQFLLSDEERDILLELCLNHVAGRVPVIVTCSHFSSRIACERAQKSEAAGAKMLMLMPPYHGAALKADEKGIYEHFQQISEAVSIPIMIQDAPLSGISLSVDLLVRMAHELDGVSCFKIEMPGTADKLRKLIESGGSAIEGPFDGEESITLMADLDAGATGTMPSAMIPDLIKPVVEHHLAGRREQAAEQYGKILPLINYENRQCGLRATKALMLEGGVITSERVRHPMPALPPESRKGLLELAKFQDPVVLRWGK